MENIVVTMLGKFDLIHQGKSLLTYIGNSPKSTLMLKYLILNKNKPIRVSDLVEVFWPDDERSTNPESALKTMVSRIRTSLSKANPDLKNCIIAENRSYRWNPEIPCDVDVFEFEALSEQVQGARTLDDDTRQIFMQIINMYGGDLSYSTYEEEGIVSRSMYLHHLYLQDIYHFIELLKAHGDVEMVVQVCRLALDIDTFDEKLNLALMQALTENGQNNAALAQYRHITSAYYKYLGIEPSDKILNFYSKLVKTDLATEADIQTIRKDLLVNVDDNGAFICDYSIFKDIYQLQLRNFERQESRMFLALITVDYAVDDYFNPMQLDSIMRDLLDVLKQCLRKGDTISRYSPSQYAILLPMMNYSNGNIVMNRVKQLFYKLHAGNNVKLIFQFGDLVPDDAVSNTKKKIKV